MEYTLWFLASSLAPSQTHLQQPVSRTDPHFPWAVYSKTLLSIQHYIDDKPFERHAQFTTKQEAQGVADALGKQHPSKLVFVGVNVGPHYACPSDVWMHALD